MLTTTSYAYAYDDGDFQIWNTETEEVKIDNNTKVALEQEFRWADNANDFYYHHYDAGFAYTIEKYLNIGAGYRHIYELKSGKFKEENSPYITAALLWDFKGFKFEDKNRGEYRHFDYQADSWRYRNKFTVKAPWEFTFFKIQPYIADEMLFNVSATNRLSQNRLSSGAGLSLTKNIKAEAYYMFQSTRNGSRWTDANVLGTKLKLTF